MTSRRENQHHKQSEAVSAETHESESSGRETGHNHVPRWPAVAGGAAAAVGVAWAAAFVSI